MSTKSLLTDESCLVRWVLASRTSPIFLQQGRMLKDGFFSTCQMGTIGQERRERVSIGLGQAIPGSQQRYFDRRRVRDACEQLRRHTQHIKERSFSNLQFATQLVGLEDAVTC